MNKVLLVCVGQGYSKEYQAYYNRYKIIIDGELIEKLYSKEQLKNLGYWVNRSKVMSMRVWGMNQEYEAKIHLGYFFNWHKEGQDWGEYEKMLNNRIKAIY